MNTEIKSKKEEILEKHKQFLSPNHITYFSEPLALDRGDGQFVWDVDGNKYLDFFGGILTTSVGHNRPEVLEKIRAQSEKLLHTSTLYASEPHAELAARLAIIAPGDISVSYFSASGTEADESAIITAQLFTGNQEVIALRNGYSGRSAVGMSLTGNANWRIGGTHISYIKHALAPNCYRCPLKMKYPSCGIACADDVEEVIKTTTSGKVAAFIAEPIQGVGGFVTPPAEYFKIVAEIVRHYGGLFISDEVQTGFGRTGEKWWGIEHSGFKPDIITMAKGIANGLPLGNMMTTPKIAQDMKNKYITISTFGGNPVSCNAGIAVLDILENEATPDRSLELGFVLREGLNDLKEKFAIIGDVRGRGLMQGMEFVKDPLTKEPAPDLANQCLQACKDEGLLVGKGGLFGNVIRITPPLTIDEDDISLSLEKLENAINKIR